MSTVIVIGAGIGGISQAFELRKALHKDHKVVVVNDSDRFEFTPSNPWVAVGWRKESDITVDLPKLFAKHNIQFNGSGAARVHPVDKRIDLGDGGSMAYDYLVSATGPKLAFDEIPGLGPHGGFTSSVCKTGHAAKAYEDVEALAANPGPVVVGAAQGASCFGPAYEYAFILDTELKKRKIRHKVPMVYVTPEPYIGHLGLDGVGDTKGLMESELRNRHIRWLTNSKIDQISAGRMTVTQVDEAGKDLKQQEREFKHAMILPAFKGVAFLALPQIPPRNTNWASRGKWVHLAKIGFEKYFLRKVRAGQTEPYYEKLVLKLMGAERVEQVTS